MDNKQTNYLEAFTNTDAVCPGDFELFGDILLVRELPPEEHKTKSGLIIAPMGGMKQLDGIEANRPCFVEVLKVGAGFFSEGTDHVPLDSKPGDIILVGKLSVKWLSTLGPITSTPENNLGLVREDEIQARFRGQEVRDRYFKVLGEKLAAY